LNKLFSLFFFTTINLIGQNVIGPKEQILEFYTRFQKDGGTAIIEFLNSNEYFSSKPELENTLGALADKLNKLIADEGRVNGQMHFRSFGIENIYEIHEYLTLFEDRPIIFQFVFYQHNNNMLIHHFSYNSLIREEVENNYKDFPLKN
jgi:hypothetical protein